MTADVDVHDRDPDEWEAAILVIDNYDSFAYNLVQYVAEALSSAVPSTDDPLSIVEVRRNDAITADGIRELDPDGIVVSPGPGTPEEAGVSMAVFGELSYPALGVCLGHQALCAANGIPVGHAPSVVHGKPSVVAHDDRGIYEGIPNPVRVGRYHSLAVEREDLTDPLIETALTDDERGVVMGVRHADRPHEGVQFHPESILTAPVDESADAPSLAVGKRMIRNFVESCTTT